MSVTMKVTKPVTVSTTAPQTKDARISLEVSRKGNTFVLINGVKVAVFRKDGYFNRLLGADSTVTGFRHLPDGRIASPAT